jgi:hypothetical protein
MGQAKERKNPDGTYRDIKGPGYKIRQHSFKQRVVKWAEVIRRINEEKKRMGATDIRL